MEADHILPIHRGGAELDPGNVQTLCRGCHLEKSRAEMGIKDISPERAAWRGIVSPGLGSLTEVTARAFVL